MANLNKEVALAPKFYISRSLAHWYMSSDDSTDDLIDRDPTDCKVGRLIEEYSLSGTGDDLKNRWTGQEYEMQSLRDLADWFNQLLLANVLEESTLSLIGGDVEHIYNLLTDDNLSSGEQAEIRRTLEREGINLDQLTEDFVSHRAIHTYLTQYRGVEKPKTETDPVKSGRERLQRLRERVVIVAENTLRSLSNADHLALDEFSILVNIRVTCEACGAYHDLEQLLRNGGCDCQLSD